MSDVEETIAALTTPKPDSPVCVEVKKLEFREEGTGLWKAETPVGAFTILQNHEIRFSCWYDGKRYRIAVDCPTLEAAQAACDADHERRTLELVNAWSVESVRAEERERCAKRVESMAGPFYREGVRYDLREDIAKELEAAASAIRSLTEGEG